MTPTKLLHHATTVEDVTREVALLRILELIDRPAAAAGAEQLRVDVLNAIANGVPDPQALAAAALVTVEEDIGGD